MNNEQEPPQANSLQIQEQCIEYMCIGLVNEDLGYILLLIVSEILVQLV